MKTNNQMGFSLIELLLVVVIIGVIAGLAVPSLLKAKQSSENGNAFASLRTMLSSEVSFFSQNGRYGRLAEINAASSGSLGVNSPPNSLLRGRFTFTMTPAAPTDAQLKNNFHITVTKGVSSSEQPYTLDMDESGTIIEVYGTN
jgi:type IV pilus assembly protein PilA